MAVEILPSELPRESSLFFGNLLLPYLHQMVNADLKKEFRELALPAPIKRSVILHKGALTPDYTFIAKFLTTE